MLPSANGSNSNSPKSVPEENDPRIYFKERERLKSFHKYVCRDKNFVFDDELKKKYARAGFYWTQQHEKVKCAFCHFYLVDLKAGDTDPVRLHYRFQSSCPLYNYRESRNIPIDEYLLQKDLFIKSYYPQYDTNEERLETFKKCIQSGEINQIIAKQLTIMGYFVCRPQMIECHYCRVKCKLTEDISRIINQHGEQKKLCPFQMSLWKPFINFKNTNEMIQFEASDNVAKKLSILDQIRNIISDLEKLGFQYFTAKCSQRDCNAEIDCCQHKGHNILVEHARISPKCKLSSICHPYYAITSHRIASFNDYDQSPSPYPSPLSAIGFFYSGNCVIKCFFCNCSIVYLGLANIAILQMYHRVYNWFKPIKCYFLDNE